MSENWLVKLFEHNHWANQRIIQACLALSDEQLDAPPTTATRGTIRETLLHLVSAQRNYLALLTRPLEERRSRPPLEFSELEEVERASAEGLIALVKDAANRSLPAHLETRDGYLVEPWVVIVQIINHAHEHREQISSMLSALGLTPPRLDGWSYGEAANALKAAER